ncbi:hypothetical protein [Streptomyces griseus]|uniref:hypothetical protein n=1 Tax=Streptomyces griseus TaxID=1911 RepID=UPI0008402307|nr:hypothetical protein [Streptomyces griseus]
MAAACAWAPNSRGRVPLGTECDLGDLKVYGWVDDTRTDGKCAVVRIDPDAGTTREFEACGSGTRRTFSVTFDYINSAQTKLFLR